MASLAVKHFDALSKGLDPRLLRFFKKYPPVIATTISTTEPPAIPNASIPEANPPSLLPYQGPNPFRPHKHETTGLWHNPKFSLRRQADLMKLAEQSGLETIMPPSIKSSQYRLERRMEGLKVKGTGVGQKVKGHWWERSLYTRLQARRQAMLDMPNLIYRWKQVCIVRETRDDILTIASSDVDVAGRNGPNEVDLDGCENEHSIGVRSSERLIISIQEYSGVLACCPGMIESSMVLMKMFQLPMARYPLRIGIVASNMWNMYSSKRLSCLRDEAMKSLHLSTNISQLLAKMIYEGTFDTTAKSLS